MTLAVWEEMRKKRQGALDSPAVSASLKPPSNDESLLISALSIRRHKEIKINKSFKKCERGNNFVKAVL